MITVNVWKKDSGNLLSHKSGLTKEQIELFKNLKPGDRLMVTYVNKPGATDSSPCAYIRVYTSEFARPKQDESEDI